MTFYERLMKYKLGSIHVTTWYAAESAAEAAVRRFVEARQEAFAAVFGAIGRL
jgi:hypothetical protein